MNYCDNCGEKIGEGFSFCQKCGKPLNSSKEKKKKKETTFTGLEVKYEMILIYLIPIVALIACLIKDKKYSDFVKFNYQQAACLFICNLIASLPLGIITLVVPLAGVLSFLISIVLFVFSIMALINAYNGVQYKIPFICDLTEKIFK